MATNLVKATDETSYRARADRSIQSGRVISIDSVTHTAILDVGMVDNDGVPVYMEDVPFSPQNPPHANDTIALLRTNSSPYSMVLGSGAQVGGANSGQVVTAAGAVSSLKKTGETAGQQGDITLDPGTGITITRVGKVFTFAAPPASTGTASATAGAATLNTQRGTITSEALTTAAGADWVLTLTNNQVSASSIVLASVDNGSNTTEGLAINRVTPGSGSVVIHVRNTHVSAALNGTVKVNFAVL